MTHRIIALFMACLITFVIVDRISYGMQTQTQEQEA